MNQVDDVALHFLGMEKAGAEEKWIAGDAPQTHRDYVGGGTYRHVSAPPLEYDSDHNFKLNVWSYVWPRFTKPFCFGRAANDMSLMLMLMLMLIALTRSRTKSGSACSNSRSKTNAENQLGISNTSYTMWKGVREKLWVRFIASKALRTPNHDEAIA